MLCRLYPRSLWAASLRLPFHESPVSKYEGWTNSFIRWLDDVVVLVRSSALPLGSGIPHDFDPSVERIQDWLETLGELSDEFAQAVESLNHGLTDLDSEVGLGSAGAPFVTVLHKWHAMQMEIAGTPLDPRLARATVLLNATIHDLQRQVADWARTLQGQIRDALKNGAGEIRSTIKLVPPSALTELSQWIGHFAESARDGADWDAAGKREQSLALLAGMAAALLLGN